jgi:hypothetical protein
MASEAPAEPAGEVSQTGPVVHAEPNAEPVCALERAREALASTAETLGRLGRERDAALLADADDEVARLDDELARVQKTQKTLTDKVALMAAEASRLEAEQAALAHEARIKTAEDLFTRRDEAVADLQLHLQKAEAAFRKVHALGIEARTGWAWSHGKLGGTLTTASDLVLATQSSLYKLGGRPAPLGGAYPVDAPPAFPGGRCPRIELLQTPSALPDLLDEYRDASRFSSDVMRNVIRLVDPVPPTSSALTDDAGRHEVTAIGPAAGSANIPAISPEVAKLLERQNALAMRDMTADDLVEYQTNSRLIEQMSA